MELTSYKLPKEYGIAANSKRQLRTKPPCSDGFEGQEIQPTGRTIPVKRLRTNTHIVKPAFAINYELTLVPYRCFSDDIKQSQEQSPEGVLTSAHEQSHTYTKQPDTTDLNLGQALNYINGVEEVFCDKKISDPNPVTDNVHQLPAPGTLRVQSPSIDRHTKRRFTFTDTIEVQQRLTMVSAPISAQYDEDNDDGSSDEEGEDSGADTVEDETGDMDSEESEDSEDSGGSGISEEDDEDDEEEDEDKDSESHDYKVIRYDNDEGGVVLTIQPHAMEVKIA